MTASLFILLARCMHTDLEYSLFLFFCTTLWFLGRVHYFFLYPFHGWKRFWWPLLNFLEFCLLWIFSPDPNDNVTFQSFSLKFWNWFFMGVYLKFMFDYVVPKLSNLSWYLFLYLFVFCDCVKYVTCLSLCLLQTLLYSMLTY